MNKTKSKITPLIDASVKDLNQGINVATGCSKTFDMIVNDSERINVMVGETFEAFQEQNTAVQEISKAVTNLDLLTQQNSQSAKNNVEYAVALNKEASDMNKITEELTYIIKGKAA